MPTYIKPIPAVTKIRRMPSHSAPSDPASGVSAPVSDTPAQFDLPASPGPATFTSAVADGTSGTIFINLIPGQITAASSSQIPQAALDQATRDYEAVRTDLLSSGFVEYGYRSYVKASNPNICPSSQIVGEWARDNQRLLVVVARSGPGCPAVNNSVYIDLYPAA